MTKNKKQNNKPFLLILILVLGISWIYQNSQTTHKQKLNHIEHIVVIVEENKSYKDIVENSDAPYINSLIKQGSIATNYYATERPSEPNYIEMVSGQKSEIMQDCIPSSGNCSTKLTSFVDRIEAKHLTWKGYMESMPSNCSTADTELYKVKHDPFVYFDNIRLNKARCNAHVVPYKNIYKDFSNSKTTPNYSFITPNICNDMHDCSVSVGDVWLSREVPTILNSPAFRDGKSLLVITWDEGNKGSNNHVLTLFSGPSAKKDFRSNIRYDHITLFHTTQSLLGLGDESTGPIMEDMLH